MIFLGAALPGEDFTATPYNHSQYAMFDDGVLSAGAALYAGLAMRRLAEAGPVTTASPRGME
jgi:hypothetical protein